MRNPFVSSSSGGEQDVESTFSFLLAPRLPGRRRFLFLAGRGVVAHVEERCRVGWGFVLVDDDRIGQA